MILSCIILILLLFGCCYLPAFAIFHDHANRVSLAHCWVYMTVGLGSLGGFVILAKAAGIDMRVSILPCGLLGVYALIRYRKQCIPEFHRLKYERHALVALLISAVYFFHIFIPGILMGRGAYPSVFVSLDIAYYLGQIHALLRSDAWPPMSLNFLGGSGGAHYGSQSICALLARLTGFTPHASAFLIYMPITTLGIISVAWLIVRDQKSEKYLIWIGVLLLLFCTYYPLSSKTYAMLKAFWAGDLSVLLRNNIFRHWYPSLSDQFGFFIAITLIYCLQNFSIPSSRKLAVFLVGILVAFKSPYFPTIGMGFGLWVIGEIFRSRNKKFLLLPLTSLVIGIGFQRIAGATDAVSVLVTPWELIREEGWLASTVGSFIIYTLPLGIALKYRASLTKQSTLYYWFFIIPPMVLGNIFGLVRIADYSSYRGGLLEITRLIPLFLGMFVFAVLRTNWTLFTRRAHVIIALCVVGATLCPLTHNVLYTLMSPYLVVDNKPLAEALAVIPVHGTVIVTNDFRYPGENYRKDLRQFQLPALFGHQAYAVDFLYERYPDSKERLELQRKFQKSKWKPELESLAQQLGWTHLVIRRAAPHPKEIPLPLIFENNTYQVYVFKHVTSQAGGMQK
jgi:hypothetical protein